MIDMLSFSYNKKDIKNLLPLRNENSNKCDFGRVLIIGGSENIVGAPYFSAISAYRIGAGLVEIFTHENNRFSISSLLPEALFSYYNNGFDKSKLQASMDKSNIIAIGMGLSTSDIAKDILCFVLENYNKPLLIDADALNIISNDKKAKDLFLNYKGIKICTPHYMEMSRLIGKSIEEIKNDRINIAQNFADKTNSILILKDHRTIVIEKSRNNFYLNTSGNVALSKGGSGDVLDGIIAGLIAQDLDSFAASTLGVYIHGLCGDEYSKNNDCYSLLARNIVDNISLVIKDNL